MASGKQIDWESVEREYRIGIRSLRDIGNEFSVSHTAIKNRARKECWDRDLTARIKARAKAIVSKQQVSKQNALESRVNDKQVIEANATVISDKILEHRADIVKKRELVNKLFEELEALTGGKEMIETLALALEQGDFEAMAKEVKKLATLPSRIKGFSELVSSYRSLILMERQAFSMDDEVGTSGDLESFFKEVTTRNKGMINEG